LKGIMQYTVLFVRAVLVLCILLAFFGSAFPALAKVLVWTALAGIVVFIFEAIGLIGLALDFMGRPLPHQRKD